MAELLTSINTIADRITRHPLMEDVPYESIIDYTVDFMRIVGVPDMFTEKTCVIDIDEYKGLLPDDYYEVIQVRDVKTNIAYRYATDSFFYSDTNRSCDFTYKIQGGVIFVNNRVCKIEMAYMAIPVDGDCVPMIPDNASFLRALEAYIKIKVFTVLFDTDKIKPTVLQNAQQEYAWAVGDCQSEFNRLTIDKAESYFANFRRLITKYNSHSEGFKYNNIPEKIKRH